MPSPEPPERRSPTLALLMALPLLGMGGAGILLWAPSAPPVSQITGVLLIVSTIALTLVHTARLRSQRLERSRMRLREAEDGLEEALRQPPLHTEGNSASQNLALPGLWAVTHRRLDHYHGIALDQASRSFRNAQIAMGLGFALLIGFVIVALRASTTAGSLVAGALGAVAAALAGYVSRTFVRSQEGAASHLRAYFDQPLEFSRYLAAERLVVDSNLNEEQRAEVVTALVQAMTASPAYPATEPANGTTSDAGNSRI